jgi:hypothetical protein
MSRGLRFKISAIRSPAPYATAAIVRWRMEVMQAMTRSASLPVRTMGGTFGNGTLAISPGRLSVTT